MWLSGRALTQHVQRPGFGSKHHRRRKGGKTEDERETKGERQRTGVSGDG